VVATKEIESAEVAHAWFVDAKADNSELGWRMDSAAQRRRLAFLRWHWGRARLGRRRKGVSELNAENDSRLRVALRSRSLRQRWWRVPALSGWCRGFRWYRHTQPGKRRLEVLPPAKAPAEVVTLVMAVTGTVGVTVRVSTAGGVAPQRHWW